MAEGSSGVGVESSAKVPFIPLSPPKCEVDDTPLHGKSLNRNKESLKVKLMLRRPRHDLINRGVLPAVSTSYNFYEQRQKLDMAKKHDILKHKMQRRPLREELVRQHILEDSPNNFAPALVEKQKQLKRARIADTINEHLCQRPGPLELVKANILHTSEDLEKAVKEGQLLFKSTSEGEPRKHPSFYLLQEDESSSEGGHSPDQTEGCSGRGSRESSVTPLALPFNVGCPTQIGPPAVVASPQSLIFAATPSTFSSLTSVGASLASVTSLASLQSSLSAGVTILASSGGEMAAPSPLTSNTSSLSPLSSLPSPAHHVIPSPQGQTLAQTLLVAQTPLPHALTTPPLQNSAPGKDQSKSRKKSKGKSQPKARTIKFHEYKGPPSAAKKDHNLTPVETSYDILLQQQNLFLQCQLELKQKYTQILFPAGLKTSTNDGCSGGMALSSVLTLTKAPQNVTCHTPIAPAPSSVPPAPPPPPNKIPSFRLPTKLEELKVSDLRAELKRRNLPVSGSKPNLITRLKMHNKNTASSPGNTINSMMKKTTDVNSDLAANLFKPRQSIDLADDASASGILEASMEVGEDSIASPTYSHISTRPPSVAPMEVDFDVSMDVTCPLTPLTPANTFFDETGSIHTPPPPPPPPPPLPLYNRKVRILEVTAPAKQFLSPSEAAERPQEGIQQLQQKIKDLQQQLRDTQLQLQVKQQQNLVKAQELYKRNSCDVKLSQREILQQQLDNRKQMQLQSQMEQLQQNLKKEQKQLAKNVHEDSKFNILDELLQMHVLNKEPTPTVQEHPYQQQYALISEQLSDNSLRIKQPVSTQQAYRVSDFQTKSEDDWLKSMPTVTMSSSASKDHRPSSVAATNGFLLSAHHRTSSLPNFSGISYSQDGTNILPTLDLENLDASSHTPEAQKLKAPPNYSEATKVLNDSNQDIYGMSYKNQQVDDVIEILIKNGELSPSAVGVLPLQMTPHNNSRMPHVEMDSRKQAPQPPPPPPPIKQSGGASSSSQGCFPAVSSPSIFADLVMGVNSPADVNLDLDLPVFNGIELSHLEAVDGLSEKGREPTLPDIKMGMSQDLDVASWINSLTSAPSVSFAQPNATASWISLVASNSSTLSKPKNAINSLKSNSSASSSSSGYSSTFHQSDPLLGSNSDQLDFFSIEDIDLKAPTQNVHGLSWERLDFTT